MEAVHTKINLTKIDRFGMLAGGIALLGFGLSRVRTLTGGGAAGLGGYMLYQAYTGYNPMLTPLGIRVNQNPAEGTGETIVFDEAITINASAAQLYAFWREVDNLPRIAPRLRSVEKLDDKRSRWTVDGPRGVPIEWESEVTHVVPDREISWRTTHQDVLTHFGTVIFREATGGRGAVVGVHLEYVSPAGAVGTAIARIMGQSPQRLTKDALRNLKQLVEIGWITTTTGQPAGAQRPADAGADTIPGARYAESNLQGEGI
jgi:uncharacterized membrane protein